MLHTSTAHIKLLGCLFCGLVRRHPELSLLQLPLATLVDNRVHPAEERPLQHNEAQLTIIHSCARTERQGSCCRPMLLTATGPSLRMFASASFATSCLSRVRFILRLSSDKLTVCSGPKAQTISRTNAFQLGRCSLVGLVTCQVFGKRMGEVGEG